MVAISSSSPIGKSRRQGLSNLEWVPNGPIAQLAERSHGMREVESSNLSGSTSRGSGKVELRLAGNSLAGYAHSHMAGVHIWWSH